MIKFLCTEKTNNIYIAEGNIAFASNSTPTYQKGNSTTENKKNLFYGIHFI